MLTPAGMKKELQAIRDFGVYGEVIDRGQGYSSDAVPTIWAKRPKGSEVRCRLVCKGCYQETLHKGDTNASPLLINQKLLLLVDLTKNFRFNFYDVGTTLCHAGLKEEVYVKPPKGF